MKKRNLLLISATFLAFTSCNNDEKATTTTTDNTIVSSDTGSMNSNMNSNVNSGMEADRTFAMDVADGGMAEVELGKLAASNGSSSSVKNLAKMMVTDHSKANEELKGLAAQKNIVLPAAVSDMRKQAYDKLATLKGTDFDMEYTDIMVKDHKETIDKFQKEADSGSDADIKAWAAGKLSALKHHLEMSQSAYDAVRKNK